MIFIKNMTQFKGKDFGLTATQDNESTVLTLLLPNEGEVDLLASTATGIYASIKKSLDHIGKKTKNVKKNEKSISTQLLDNYPTEVIFYIKEKKISLEKQAGDYPIPINVEVVEDADTNKRFPRDMVVIISPYDGENVATLKYDPRNLVGKPIIATVDEFQITIAMVKWPVWANLKFPAYLSLVVGEEVIGSIQLSSKTDNNVERNTIVDADDKEALDYLEESRKIMEERAAANKAAKRTAEEKAAANRVAGNKTPRQNQGNNNNGKKNFNRGGKK